MKHSNIVSQNICQSSQIYIRVLREGFVTNLRTQSAGEVTTELSQGSWMGLSPAFSLLAKNWLKVSQPLGVLGLPSIMESYNGSEWQKGQMLSTFLISKFAVQITFITFSKSAQPSHSLAPSIQETWRCSTQEFWERKIQGCPEMTPNLGNKRPAICRRAHSLVEPSRLCPGLSSK